MSSSLRGNGAGHVTRDYRNLRPDGNGRELEFLDSEDFPPQGGVHNVSEGALWKTHRGWYMRQGEYWAPIYPPADEGALEAAQDAGSDSLDRESRGYEGEIVTFNAADFLDALTEAGWKLVRGDA